MIETFDVAYVLGLLSWGILLVVGVCIGIKILFEAKNHGRTP